MNLKPRTSSSSSLSLDLNEVTKSNFGRENAFLGFEVAGPVATHSFWCLLEMADSN